MLFTIHLRWLAASTVISYASCRVKYLLMMNGYSSRNMQRMIIEINSEGKVHLFSFYYAKMQW